MSNSLNAAAFVVAMLAFAPQATEARVFSQWVQLGPDGASSVRAITDGQCPQVAFDGISAPMNVRAEPEQRFGNVPSAAFPVRSCELTVPPGAVAATLDGRVLPLPRPNPQRILVFGDTGCRVVPKATELQDCDDRAKWPFPKIATAAAKARPDLVIHVGDYHYREGPCPAERSGCARSLGYGFDAWDADFFEPAAPLLAAAPWIMVRGNHEDCSRAGEGWIRFLDWRPAANCRDLSGIFVARLGGFGVVVVDGASAEDGRTDANVLRDQFAAVAAKVPSEAWLVSHRPLNAMRSARNQPVNVVENAVLELALGNLLPPGVRMTVAGHIHFFQAVDFGGASPPQLVVGTGGDNLDRSAVPPVSVVGADINGHKVVNSVTYAGFAYMVWDRTGDLWTGTLFDADGKALDRRCRLFDRSLACGP